MKNKHLLELSAIFQNALKNERYEICEEIKKEVERRITDGLLTSKDLDIFRYYNPKTDNFEGKHKLEEFNNLFDKVK